MSITFPGDKGFNPTSPIKKTMQTQQPSTTGKTEGKDAVEFSSFLQNVGQTRDVSDSAPVDRAEKVQALKQQIASGSYNPDPKEVAASLLKNITRE